MLIFLIAVIILVLLAAVLLAFSVMKSNGQSRSHLEDDQQEEALKSYREDR